MGACLVTSPGLRKGRPCCSGWRRERLRWAWAEVGGFVRAPGPGSVPTRRPQLSWEKREGRQDWRGARVEVGREGRRAEEPRLALLGQLRVHSWRPGCTARFPSAPWDACSLPALFFVSLPLRAVKLWPGLEPRDVKIRVVENLEERGSRRSSALSHLSECCPNSPRRAASPLWLQLGLGDQGTVHVQVLCAPGQAVE